ncbi:MAG: efflux RND transporter periplasmic adaptor subunit [Candidatus Omnitrophica bacterium]|nr:efflux RND transporter periplasmic adaptor subunit [Candidatus Omnitrophota bacterium]MDD5771179.1 efflux RND transporter periplasmic adaptor subunit [Candidatus Omnitrophota bacterium]
MKKKIKPAIFILVILVVCGIAAAYFWKTHDRSRGMIKVSGNIEGDDVRLSFRVQGQIIELLTDEGKVVKAGETVARLNTDELVKIRDNAEGSLRAAEHQYALDKLDYERAENLFKAGAIPMQQRDAAKTLADADKANIEALNASFELAKTRLGFAELISPLNGYVLVKSSLAGEVVQIGAPVFTVIDLNSIWVTAYINETDLGRVKLDQEAYIVTDTYPGKRYKGRVSFISSEAEFTPKTIQTTEERVKLVYRIKVMADNSSLELKPGMPADAYIIE